MDDVDIVGGGNVTFKSMFTEAQAGMEASAVRGTKTYANFSVSGEKLVNSDFRKSMGFWFPKLKKEIWRGSTWCTDNKYDMEILYRTCSHLYLLCRVGRIFFL